MSKRATNITIAILLGSVLSISGFSGAVSLASAAGGILEVCATVPDLGILAKETGGDRVSVTVFAKGSEDPHFIDAKPGFIKILSQADLLIEVGMELEVGWLPVLLKNARNEKVLPGNRGHLDASAAITPLDVPAGSVDRSMGDVHPAGNPHYLLDPLSGIKVARLIRDKLSELRPSDTQYFNDRYSAFYRKLGTAMVGEKLAGKYDFEKLAILYQYGKLETFLKEQKEEGLLGGWLGMMLPFHGIKAVADHNLWPYFAKTFRIGIIGFLEPKPGVTPTTKHLSELIAVMQKEGVRIILKSSYFDPKSAELVSQKTGARVVPMVHQSGASGRTEDYISMVNYNVIHVVEALRSAK